MLDQINATRVPAEFIGLARAFRSEVRAVDIQMDKALHEVCKPLRERLKRKPTLRAAQLPDFARSYRQSLPARFRIGKVTAARDRVEFGLSETRLCVSWLVDDAWNNPDAREPGVTLCKFALYVRRGALGRRFERGHDRSHEALTRDLALLADAGDDAERVNTSHGFWLGAMTNANNTGTGGVTRIRNIRTWIDADG